MSDWPDLNRSNALGSLRLGDLCWSHARATRGSRLITPEADQVRGVGAHPGKQHSQRDAAPLQTHPLVLVMEV